MSSNKSLVKKNVKLDSPYTGRSLRSCRAKKSTALKSPLKLTHFVKKKIKPISSKQYVKSRIKSSTISTESKLQLNFICSNKSSKQRNTPKQHKKKCISSRSINANISLYKSPLIKSFQKSSKEVLRKQLKDVCDNSEKRKQISKPTAEILNEKRTTRSSSGTIWMVSPFEPSRRKSMRIRCSTSNHSLAQLSGKASQLAASPSVKYRTWRSLLLSFNKSAQKKPNEKACNVKKNNEKELKLCITPLQSQPRSCMKNKKELKLCITPVRSQPRSRRKNEKDLKLCITPSRSQPRSCMKNKKKLKLCITPLRPQSRSRSISHLSASPGVRYRTRRSSMLSTPSHCHPRSSKSSKSTRGNAFKTNDSSALRKTMIPHDDLVTCLNSMEDVKTANKKQAKKVTKGSSKQVKKLSSKVKKSSSKAKKSSSNVKKSANMSTGSGYFSEASITNSEEDYQEDPVTLSWDKKLPKRCTVSPKLIKNPRLYPLSPYSSKKDKAIPKEKMKKSKSRDSKSPLSPYSSKKDKAIPKEKMKSKSRESKSVLSDDSGTYSNASSSSIQSTSQLPLDDLTTFNFDTNMKFSGIAVSTPAPNKRKPKSLPVLNVTPVVNLTLKDGEAKAKKKPATLPNGLKKAPAKGTLKRKRDMLNNLKEKTDGYEDDIFENLKNDIFKNTLRKFDEESDLSSVSIVTPKFERVLTPFVPKKEPKLKELLNANDLLQARKNAEEYLYRRNKKRRTESLSDVLYSPPVTDKELPEKRKLEFVKKAMDKVESIQKAMEKECEGNDEEEDAYFSDVSV